jgi:tripartite-type tricarboxylate transporter receptor subunit TctC
MHGAGGLLVANHLFNVAPKDGGTIASFPHGVAMEPLYGNAAAKFNSSEFNWIGSVNNEVSVCAAWHGLGVATFEQAREKRLIIAADTLESSVGRHPTVLNAVLGANFKIVKGYAGLGAMRLALERGEAQAICGWSWSSVVSTSRDWLKEKKINVFLQMSMSKHPDLPNVPLVLDLAKTDQQRQVLKLIFAPQVMGRPIVAPPGVPSDRVKALRAAFDATMKDEKFIAEAKKFRIEISPTRGEEIQNLIKDIYTTPKPVVEAAIKSLR